MIALVKFVGIQEGFGHVPPDGLYNVRGAFGKYRPGCSVLHRSITDAGFAIPPLEMEREYLAWQAYAHELACPKNGQSVQDTFPKTGQTNPRPADIECSPRGETPTRGA